MGKDFRGVTCSPRMQRLGQRSTSRLHTLRNQKWSLELLHLLADGNLETTNHDAFSRSSMANMRSIAIFALVSPHRLEMATFLLETFSSFDNRGSLYFTFPAQWLAK